MSKDPVIISQDSSTSIIKVHEHQYGQILLDLTFLEIDEGTVEFTDIVQDGVTYSYGSEEVYKRFSADKDSLKLQEDSVFVGNDLSFINDPEDADPRETSALITSFSFKYKSNGVEKEHTIKIGEVIDDIDRSGSFVGNNYTIDIYGKEVGQLNEETKKLILDNTEYVIKDLSTKMSWKGSMDFGINVNTDANKTDGVVSAIAFNFAENSLGESVHSATHEQRTGEDLNGITVDLGFNVSLQDDYDTNDGKLEVYNSTLWFDPDPNPKSFINKPINDGSSGNPIDYFDFISIVYHEFFHSMGIASNPNMPNEYSKNILPVDTDGNYYYSSDRVKVILDNGILLDNYGNPGGGDHFNLGDPKENNHTIEFKNIFKIDKDNTEPVIISQSLLNSSISVYEGRTSSKNILDLTFLNADKGSFEFKNVTNKGDTTIFSYGSEKVYQRFEIINNSIKLYDASYFEVDKGLNYTYDAEGEDPRLTYQNIETVSLNYLVDGSKGEITTIMNSNGYYDYSWREPMDIDWAVIEDIGWNKKSEGTLSEKINPSKNVLKAFSETSKSGTQNFSTGDNIIVADGQAKTLRGLDGDDTYFISNLLPENSSIEVIDINGNNVIQIPSNTYIDKTIWTKDAARITFEGSRTITINGADDFTFNIGGNVTDGSLGVDLSYSEFAFYFGVTDVLNISSGSETGNVADIYII